MPFIANTDEQRREMLQTIGVPSFDALISDIPESVRLKGPLDLPPALSQLEVSRHLMELAAANADLTQFVSFLGAGAYDHYIPAMVNNIISRPEFFTSYTPYQAEVAQGNLQVIYEYQSMICELTGMYAANASMYDGGSALAEAVLLAFGATRKKKVLVPDSIHPHYRQIINTYTDGLDIEIETLNTLAAGVTGVEEVQKKVDDSYAAIVVQHPNFFGNLEEVEKLAQLAHAHQALFIVSVDPMSLALLTPPGAYGADVVVGEAQGFGNSLSYGGPYLGIFAVTEALLRKMPGRIAGATVDRRGKRGFVLTLQTREQHIRREKATSNICTNQALNATAATVYLALMGKEGLREAAHQCLQKAHYLAEGISRLDGYARAHAAPFFKEFTVKTPIAAEKIIQKLLSKKIFAGVSLQSYFGADDHLLIAVTEKRTKSEMDTLIAALDATRS